MRGLWRVVHLLLGCLVACVSVVSMSRESAVLCCAWPGLALARSCSGAFSAPCVIGRRQGRACKAECALLAWLLGLCFASFSGHVRMGACVYARRSSSKDGRRCPSGLFTL